MTEWVLIAAFFAACWVLNRWAFRKDVDRAVRNVERTLDAGDEPR